MARYVGDLTDPKEWEEREKTAELVEQIAEAIRERRVREVSVDYGRDVTGHEFGGPYEVSPWTVKIDVTRRGRHEV